jgi:hypothetical protein
VGIVEDKDGDRVEESREPRFQFDTVLYEYWNSAELYPRKAPKLS